MHKNNATNVCFGVHAGGHSPEQKDLPREHPGDLHRSSPLVGVVVKLGTSSEIVRSKPPRVHLLLQPTLSRTRETTSS